MTVSKFSKKNVDKYLTVSFGIQVLLLSISLLGIGYSILKYLFGSVDTFQDLTVSAMFQPLYYSPNLVDSFSQPIGPPLILYYSLLRFVIPSLQVESILQAPFIPVLFYILFLFALFLILLNKLSENRTISFLLGFSYPVVFLVGRGNPDLLCLILFSLAVILLNKHRMVAGIIFGLLAAIKLPFVIFALLFVFKRELKLIAVTVVSLVINFFVPFMISGYGIGVQTKKFFEVTQSYFKDYVLNDGGNLFNTSIFGFIKSLFLTFNGKQFFEQEDLLQFRESVYFFGSIFTYLLVCIPAVLLVLYVYRRKGKFNENEILMVLVLLFILTPQVSAQYRLVFLLPVFAILYKTNSRLINDRCFILLFSLILLPKEFLFITLPNGQFGPFTISSLLNPPLMYFILWRALILLRKDRIEVK